MSFRMRWRRLAPTEKGATTIFAAAQAGYEMSMASVIAYN